MRFVQGDHPIGTRYPANPLISGSVIAEHMHGKMQAIVHHLQVPLSAYSAQWTSKFAPAEYSRNVTAAEDRVLRRAVLRASKIISTGEFVCKK